MKARAAPRASLRPHARRIPPAVLLARLTTELEARRPPDAVDLLRLFPRVWIREGARAWAVADLQAGGLVDARQTTALGYALRSLVQEADGVIGTFRVQRLGRAKFGNLYQLQRR